MKLPTDAVIRREKVTEYLLVPQARGDKSAFLNRAGYTEADPDRLLDDLRAQILPLEAVSLRRNKFGEYLEIRGSLCGPNGITIHVRTIWMRETLSQAVKFVTLIPDEVRRR